MIRRIAFASLALLVVLLVAAAGASAATPAEIHEDALDGVIDGDFTLAQLRAADASVPAEQREYYGWEDAYADALRRQQNPDAPPVVAPIDSNQDGQIDEKEKAVAVAKTEKLKKRRTPTAETRDPNNVSKDDIDDEETAAASSDDSDDGDDDEGGSLLIWLFILVPLAIIAFGAWRMYRQRNDEAAGMDDDRP
jgi:hypothetical protein